MAIGVAELDLLRTNYVEITVVEPLFRLLLIKEKKRNSPPSTDQRGKKTLKSFLCTGVCMYVSEQGNFGTHIGQSRLVGKLVPSLGVVRRLALEAGRLVGEG